jgi:hypothetical protein
MSEWSVLAIAGGVFIVLGIGSYLWGRQEQKNIDEALTTHTDVREFISHWPERPQPGALKIGGGIAISLGIIMVLVGLILVFVSGS